MKTQISKLSHQPNKRYSGVYQQQGRMITDADWNELVEVFKQKVSTSLGDIIMGGAPRDSGLAIESLGADIGIKTGRLYVDGIEAEVPGNGDIILFDQQDDFPGTPMPEADAVVYADVWEKTVISLEDAGIRDPALHGADTCSRSKTLAQIKSCPAGLQPESDIALNPPLGSASINVRLWEESDADSERADPCITEVAQSPIIGNYLFRVEVHNIVTTTVGDNTTAVLTLKWSEENGAEQHALTWVDSEGTEQYGYNSVPTEFGAEDWVYEYYTDKSEHHLGVNLNDNFIPVRGELLKTLDRNAILPQPGGETARYIRRWDGYCSISLTRSTTDPRWLPDVTTLSGEDKGQNLQDATSPGHGNVHSTQDEGGNYQMTFYLEKLILRLDLSSSDFVTGDYWLAMVREDATYYKEAEPVVDERVTTLNNGRCIGIRHHYLKLADIEAGLIKAVVPGTPDERRMRFPPLTDLQANDVAYDPVNKQARWEDIIETPLGAPPQPNTVQSAIDTLIDNLESSDIKYTLPEICTTLPYGATTLCEYLKELLRTRLGISDPLTTVNIKDVWDELLCQLDARKLPFDPTENSARWQSFKQPVGSDISSLHLWSSRFGTGDVDAGNAIVADHEAHVIVVGEYSGSLNLGGEDLPDLGGSNIFMLKLDPDGQHVWSLGFGGAGFDHVFGLAVDSDNNIVICGSFDGTINFGGDEFTSTGDYDIYVAKFNPTGEHLWSRAYGSTGSDQGASLVIDQSGAVIITGVFEGSLNFGGSDLSSVGDEDIFLVKLDADGAHVWSQSFGGVGLSAGVDVLVDSTDQIVLGGIFNDTINLGGSDLSSEGSWDIFVAKFGPDGSHVWSKSFGGGGLDLGVFLALDSLDHIVISGGFVDTINFGGSELHSDGGRDVYLAKLDEAGNHIWSKGFSGGGFNHGSAVAVDAFDNIAFCGQFTGELDFGGVKLESVGLDDIFFAKFDTAGGHIWSGLVGHTGADKGSGLAVDLQGDLLMTGHFEGSINFGGSDLVSAGSSDIFVAKLAGQTILPMTVQDAVDDLLRNLESSDVAYHVPTCTESPTGVPRLKDNLALSGSSDVKTLWDRLLCELDASLLPLADPRNDLFADTHTVQQALDILSTRNSGLADLVARLANAIAISGTDTQDDEDNVKDERQLRIFERPVQGDDAFLRTIGGMGLDLVRIVSALGLEYLDAAKATLLSGKEVGHSAGLLLSTLSTTEGYIALWRRIREQLEFADSFVNDELPRILAHSAAYVLGTRLINDPSSPEDPVQVFITRITDMEENFGSEGSWNGHLIRRTLLQGLYQPLFGNNWLDHNAMFVMKQILLDFLQRLWQELSQRLLLENMPELPHPPGDEWLEKISSLVQAVDRAVGGDGLVAEYDQRFDYERIEDVLMPFGVNADLAATWLRGSMHLRDEGRTVSVFSRIQNNAVLLAFDDEEQKVPDPTLVLIPSNEDGWYEFLDARVTNETVHVDMRIKGADYQVIMPVNALAEINGRYLMRGDTSIGVELLDPKTGEVRHTIKEAVIAPIEFDMYRLVSGITDELVYFSYLTLSPTTASIALTCRNWPETISTAGTFEIGTGRSLSGLQGVYTLSRDKPAEGTHLLAVADVSDGQVLVLLRGLNAAGAPVSPWWNSTSLETITVLHLRMDSYRVIGALHDQLVVQFQYYDDERETRTSWMFVPFRALHESLFDADGDILGLIVQKYSDGINPLEFVDRFVADEFDGEVFDMHAGIDPLLSIVAGYNHRRFYRCYNDIFPELYMEIPGGETAQDDRQNVHQTITDAAGTRLLSLASGWNTVEYQLVDLAQLTS